MMFVRKIDKNGLFIEDAFVDEITSDCIEMPCPSGFYLPKWNGTEWVEGKTSEEIAAIKSSVTVESTEADRLSALESAVLEMILGGSV